MSGLFVAFEGGDGAGKSTQVARLARWLADAGREVVVTRQPGGTRVGARIRELVLDPATGEVDPRAEALLYAADKAQHVFEVIGPALARGAVVVCDRYVDSLVAYQGAGRVLAEADVAAVAGWATGGLRPDLTVLLDADPAYAVARKGDKDRLEGAGDAFHRRVREDFLRLAAADPERYLVLPARDSREAIEGAVRDRVRAALAARGIVGGLGHDGRMTTGVWADLIGQEAGVEVLRRAVDARAHAMSHAWLITGPPGSGRSNAARAFAAALQCPRGGCGECNDCRTALTGAHPDVTLVRTEMLSIGVDEVRDLVRRAAMSPTTGRHQVIVVEDADRVTERGADALLKSIEEPAPRTVWILCAPTPDDVVATIRSRCRLLRLATPTTDAVARLLQARDGIDPTMAAYAARAAQGHVGRARALARDPQARTRRRDVLAVPGRLTDLGACLTAARNLAGACREEAAAATADLDARERAELEEALGFGTKGTRPRNAGAAIKDLTDQQKARAKRRERDAIDRALTELTTYFRDVLCVQTSADAELVNAELAGEIGRAARSSTPEATLRRIDAVLACRTALETNVAPLLAVEAMMIGIVEAGRG